MKKEQKTVEACAARYAATDWDKECEYPTGYYFIKGASVHVDYSAGV